MGVGKKEGGVFERGGGVDTPMHTMAGPTYGCVLLREHSLKKGILFAIYLLPLLNRYHDIF